MAEFFVAMFGGIWFFVAVVTMTGRLTSHHDR
jgi:hypothetical protein